MLTIRRERREIRARWWDRDINQPDIHPRRDESYEKCVPLGLSVRNLPTMPVGLSPRICIRGGDDFTSRTPTYEAGRGAANRMRGEEGERIGNRRREEKRVASLREQAGARSGSLSNRETKQRLFLVTRFT